MTKPPSDGIGVSVTSGIFRFFKRNYSLIHMIVHSINNEYLF